ncbi:MAG TPA: IS1182 family transposase [Nakamurella sp.]|nr:IS1182 family transposase [Nakamurella sp.]
MTPVVLPVVELGPVDKTFRRFDPDQAWLVPPSLDDWLPQEHIARFIADLVDEHLDLSAFYADYTEGRGAPPFDPRLMVRVLLLGYTNGIRSSRKLEAACSDIVAFRWLAGGEVPAYRAIAKFRKRHLSALGHLFVQALELCQAAGMVKLGRVALDGTKVRANASKRKAMSYARMTEKQKILAAEVSALLAEAERIDKAEDAQYGPNNSGLGLPAELARRETRLAKIAEAKAALEAEARERAAAEAAERAKAAGKDDEVVAERAAAAAERAVPKPSAQRNFTDPESRIMKTADGSFAQCFNAQAVVDDAHQVIVATDLNNCAADSQTLVAMTEQVTANTGSAPEQLLADAGYCSQANLITAAEITEQAGTDFLIATGRLGHDEPVPAAPRGRIPKDLTAKQRMARKLRTKAGRAAYARRKAIVEPVFGQIATLQGKHVLLRGLDNARGEWKLLAACHNLRKLHGHIGTAGLGNLRPAI